MKSIYIFLKLIKIQIKTQLEYRGAFIVLFIAKIIGFGSGFVLIYIMLYTFKTLAGWNTYELFLLYALNLMSYSIAGSFLIRTSMQLGRYIQTGEFDLVLTKPMNNFFYFIFREFSTGYFSNFIMCIIFFIICFIKLSIPATVINILFLISIIIGGALIQGAAFLFSTIPSFWMIKNESLRDFFMVDIRSFIKYPVSIYNKLVRIFLTYIVPYAFINFFPAQFLLKKHDFLGYNPIIQFCTPFIGIILFFAAYKFWFFGINHYNSSGS